MAETRYHRIFAQDGTETQEPYEVSDEELQAEADTVRLKEICDMAHSAIPLPTLAEAIAIMCKKLGLI